MSMDANGFWRRTFSAQGRANRAEFWQVSFLVWIATAVFSIAAMASAGTPAVMVTTLIGIAVLLGGAVAGTLVAVRRLHDLGRSGWWLLLFVAVDLPVNLMAEPVSSDAVQAIGAVLNLLVAIAYLVILGGVRGQRAPNRFGEPTATRPVPENSPA